jgi:hypothetical protein
MEVMDRLIRVEVVIHLLKHGRNVLTQILHATQSDGRMRYWTGGVGKHCLRVGALAQGGLCMNHTCRRGIARRSCLEDLGVIIKIIV